MIDGTYTAFTVSHKVEQKWDVLRGDVPTLIARHRALGNTTTLAVPPTERPGQEAYFEVPAQSQQVRMIRRAAGKTAKAIGFDAETCDGIMLAVGEAANNAVRYSTPRFGDDTVPCFQVWILPSRVAERPGLHVTLVNPGAFSPKTQPSEDMPMAEAMVEGGRGFPLMARLMDLVTVSQWHGQTIVRLWKALPFPA